MGGRGSEQERIFLYYDQRCKLCGHLVPRMFTDLQQDFEGVSLTFCHEQDFEGKSIGHSYTDFGSFQNYFTAFGFIMTIFLMLLSIGFGLMQVWFDQTIIDHSEEEFHRYLKNLLSIFQLVELIFQKISLFRKSRTFLPLELVVWLWQMLKIWTPSPPLHSGPKSRSTLQ